DRRKDDFLAVLAHELRNPLAAIQTSLRVLDQADATTDVVEVRAIIRRQVGHLARLVEDLLDVGRITRGKLELRRERGDLAALVRRTLDDQRTGLEQSSLTLEQSIAEGPLWVDADPARIVQALSNVLFNAQKFTPAHGRVMVTLAASEAQAYVRVSDTGV